MLDELPLLKNKETSHILLSGTTGAGKTNAFHTLLPQIRRRVNRAVVVDLTGDFVNPYYREGYDILLNPFDKRGALWSPWGECLDEPHSDALDAAVVAKSGTSEPFWEEAAKALLSTALKELARKACAAWAVFMTFSSRKTWAFLQNSSEAQKLHLTPIPTGRR